MGGRVASLGVLRGRLGVLRGRIWLRGGPRAAVAFGACGAAHPDWRRHVETTLVDLEPPVYQARCIGTLLGLV
jgi:hypothetical protein